MLLTKSQTTAVAYLAGVEPEPEPLPDAEPCPACGWGPKVVEVVEILAGSRAEVDALRALEAAEAQRQADNQGRFPGG
jgi:hypothetical protein